MLARKRNRSGLQCGLMAVAALASEAAAIAQPSMVPMQETVSRDAAKLGFSPERLKVVGEAYARGVTKGEIPGAVVIITRDGKLVYSAAIGYIDKSAKQPMQLTTRFYLASMTKPLTSVAAMILADDGRIQLDDPIAKYIPEFSTLKVGREVLGSDGKPRLVLDALKRPPTIQDLLRHTSGFTYGPFGSSLVQQAYTAANLTDYNQTNAELVAKLASIPLAYQPGEVFEYSMSTDVLGRVVEVASGMSLASFVKERITDPLGMTSTSFNADDPARLAAFANALPPFRAGTAPRWHSGGGGAVGTAPDYVRFGEMMLGNGARRGVRLLSPHSVASMTADELPQGVRYGPYDLGSLAPGVATGQGFGYGFAVRLQQGVNPAPGSVGDYHWAGASGTYFWIDPREGLVAVVLTAAPAVRAAYRVKARQLIYQAMTVSRRAP